jgi:hypothetical protein
VPEVKFKKEFCSQMQIDKKDIKVDSIWRRCVSCVPSANTISADDKSNGHSDSSSKEDLQQLSAEGAVYKENTGTTAIRHTVSDDSYLGGHTHQHVATTELNLGGLLAVTMKNMSGKGARAALASRARKGGSIAPAIQDIQYSSEAPAVVSPRRRSFAMGSAATVMPPIYSSESSKNRNNNITTIVQTASRNPITSVEDQGKKKPTMFPMFIK